jgi:hypothetical protein
MKKFRPVNFLLIIIGLFILCASPTHAATTISVLGLGDYSSNIPGGAYTANLAPGGGVDFGMGNRIISAHLGAFYDSKSYSSTFTSAGIDVTNAVKENRLLIPLSLWVTPSIFIFEFGGYGSMGIGNLTYTVTSSGSTSASTSSTYAAWGINTFDYGLLGGAGVKIPFSRVTSFIAKAQYLYGLANNSVDTSLTYKYRAILGMVGLSFSLGKSN